MNRRAWKQRVNRALSRSLGLSLTRETPLQRAEALAMARREGAAQARRKAATKREQLAARLRRLESRRVALEGRVASLKSQLAQRPATKPDAAQGEILERVARHTMTGPSKLVPLTDSVRYVARHGIPGAVVECGVWRGGSMQAVALTLLQEGQADRDLHLFDTFEGMPPPTDHDTRRGGTVTAAELLDAAEPDSKLWAVADLADVRSGMAATGYPEDLIHYHPGLVEDTIPAQAPDEIAILRLDTDWYESTAHELRHLYSRLSPGGVLLIDDYGDWEGARKATDEWLATSGEPLLLLPMGTGKIALKPGLASPLNSPSS